jgi:wyosine [tRNA(Phe)-imidazoG37] synthetase (radical SAM superfamily)
MKDFKYIYGPVPSWRLGSSLGIDPLSSGIKVCSYNCIYCQLGARVELTVERKKFINTGDVIEELKLLPEIDIDFITFSGTGEPALAENLGEMIKEVRRARPEKVAVLTNSSLLSRDDVGKDLSSADFVVCKLDAASQRVFEAVNRPLEGLKIDDVAASIKDFRKSFRGRLALQIMFVEENRAYAKDIARIAKDIKPDEVQLNTPLRPCAAKPLPRGELEGFKEYFEGLNVLSVYDARKKEVAPVSRKDTLRRRGKV